MIISALALTACGKSDKSTEATFEDIAEGTSEAVSEQTTDVITEATSEQTTDVTTESVTEQTTDEHVDEFALNYDLKETDNRYINELLNMNGEYTDSVGNTCTYHYQIPQFNSASESAKSLNTRIENDLYDHISQECSAMESGESLFSYTITYDVIQYGEIVAIVVTAPYPNDYNLYFAYTFDFGNDKELTNIELLAMNDMSEEDFVDKACKMGEDNFIETANNMNMTDDDINDFLGRAKNATTLNLPMYLDENGVLNAFVPFPSVAGASYYYHLCQF